MQKYFLIFINFFLILSFSNFAQAAQHNDAYYMQIALDLAKHNPKAPFAALIVDNKTGKILARGLNATRLNPTYHGEMVAINNAAKLKQIDWKNTTLYTTAEPCSMCQSAIVWANISRVVFATPLEYLTAHGWDQINIPSKYINKQSPFYKGTITGNMLAEKTNPLFAHG